jgi:hypothetical protein
MLQIFKNKRIKLYAKFKKSEFWLNWITFLGPVVSNDRVSVDPSKVDGVVHWARPTNVTEVRSFLGHVGLLQEICGKIF